MSTARFSGPEFVNPKTSEGESNESLMQTNVPAGMEEAEGTAAGRPKGQRSPAQPGCRQKKTAAF